MNGASLNIITPSGYHLAEAALFISVAMSLAALRISKAVVNGVPVTPEYDVTRGAISCVVHLHVHMTGSLMLVLVFLAIRSHTNARSLLGLHKPRPCCAIDLVTSYVALKPTLICHLACRPLIQLKYATGFGCTAVTSCIDFGIATFI